MFGAFVLVFCCLSNDLDGPIIDSLSILVQMYTIFLFISCSVNDDVFITDASLGIKLDDYNITQIMSQYRAMSNSSEWPDE